MLLLCGCTKQTVPGVSSEPPRSSVPNFPDVQFFVHEAEQQGAYSKPIWDYEHGPIGVSIATRVEGEPEYALRAEYQGSIGGKDFYQVTITLPPESGDEAFTEEVAYDGREIEFWSGKSYKIGMRPNLMKKSEQGAGLNAYTPQPTARPATSQ
ncbi:MAG: hypothetical protein CMO55_15920 [Verrucomicrobiales bacterium]|nr:hypothetical protein [Verrucomicrobiales bacterium]